MILSRWCLDYQLQEVTELIFLGSVGSILCLVRSDSVNRSLKSFEAIAPLQSLLVIYNSIALP